MQTTESREACWEYHPMTGAWTTTVTHRGHPWTLYVEPRGNGYWDITAAWGDIYWGAESFPDALDRADRMIRAHA